jgi:hypothetical protein
MMKVEATIKFPQLLGALMAYMTETGESWQDVIAKIEAAEGADWIKDRHPDLEWVKRGREWFITKSGPVELEPTGEKQSKYLPVFPNTKENKLIQQKLGSAEVLKVIKGTDNWGALKKFVNRVKESGAHPGAGWIVLSKTGDKYNLLALFKCREVNGYPAAAIVDLVSERHIVAHDKYSSLYAAGRMPQHMRIPTEWTPKTKQVVFSGGYPLKDVEPLLSTYFV